MAHNSPEHIQASSQYRALHDYVTGHLSLSDGHEKFCRPVEDKFMSTQKPEDVEGQLWTSWGAVAEAAKAYGQDTGKRQKLVDFVLALQRRPKLQKGDVVCKVWDATVWADLPVFGAELRECWNPPPDSATEHDKVAWLNLNAFVATLVASAHEHHSNKPDFSLYGVWSLRDAFEQQKPSSIAIETGAAWLVCAGPTLSALSKDNKSFDGKLARSGPAFQDKEWKGYSSERWSAWIEQLKKVEHDVHGARAKDMLSKAQQKTQAS